MLQATVLGSGFTPGQAIHERGRVRTSRPGESPKQHFAQPPTLNPTQPTLPSASSSSSAAFTRVPSFGPDSSASSSSPSRVDYGDEALTWVGNEVTWSRGAEVVRRFTLSLTDGRQPESIVCVTFASMAVISAGSGSATAMTPSSSSTSTSSGASAAKSTSASSSAAASSHAFEANSANTFGPFQTSQKVIWDVAPKRKVPLRAAGQTERAVVIVLPTVAHLYYATGEEIHVHIPFKVDSVWPLASGGLLFQRALEQREQRTRDRNAHPRESTSAFDRTVMSVLDDIEGEPGWALPMLYTLTERYGDLKVVNEASLTGSIRDPSPTIVPGTLTSTITTSQTVLYVAPDPYPFVVVYDADERKVVFFRRAVVPVEKDDCPSIPQHQIILNPEELLRNAANAPPTAPARRGRASMPRPTGGRASLAPNADPLDRARRSSRLSTTSFIDNGDYDLAGPFVVDPPPPPGLPLPGVRNRRQSAIGAGGDNRRASAGRRISGAAAEQRVDWEFPKSSLGILAEDLRETTMMQGLSNDAKRSEVVLERIWEWQPPGRINPANTRVFVSENRSKDSVFLNIQTTPQNYSTMLFTFHVEVVTAPVSGYVFHELRATPCRAAVPVICTRPGVLDILVITEQGPGLLSASGRLTPIKISPVVTVDGRDEVARQLASSLTMTLEGNRDAHGGVVDLVDAHGSRVTAVYGDGERVRISLDLTLPPGLTRRALESLSYLLSQSEYEELAEAFLVSLQAQPAPQRLEPGVHWRLLEAAVMTKCGTPQLPPQDARSEMLSSWTTQSDPVLRRLAKRVKLSRQPEGMQGVIAPAPSTPRVVLALHLVAQDCRLACTTETELNLIAPLIVSLASAVGRADWVDYWRRLMPSALSRAVLTSPGSEIDTSVLSTWDEPPDVLAYLERKMVSHTKAFPSPELLAAGQSSPLGNPRPCAQTKILSEVYSRMRPSSAERSAARAVSADKRASAVVNYLVSNGLSHTWLADVPFGVSIPIFEMVRACHSIGPKGMSEDFYVFVGRPDLAANYQVDKSALDLPFGADEAAGEVPTVGQLLEAHPTKQHKHPVNLPHVRFGTDKRLEEIDRIMQTTRQRTMVIDAPKGTEAEVLDYYQQVVATISHRTLSITVGQGMFTYGSRSTEVTEIWKAPRIELSVRVIPGNTVYNAPLPEGVDWPCFHSGVSSALAFSSECKGITASWIAYNRSSPLSPDHAGFLLGLGLQGHLRVLNAKAAYAYLDARHDLTAIGMLLGLGASFAGSQDSTVTRLLSLHTVALLPHGSMPLDQSPTVQSVALVAMGLVYAGSRNLRMAEVALAEISRQEMDGIEGFNDYREAYNLSSAAAFGLIMLGRGGKESSGIERDMVQQLTLCIHGNAPDIGLGKTSEPGIDTTLTAPGATLALGLMFLKTGRKDIAAILSIPDTPVELESVRPEHLLMRTFARALIMWDSVKGTSAWFEAQLPPFIQQQHNDHKRTSHLELHSEIAYFNIMAGACLGLAFRYAGAANENIHTILTNMFSLFAKAAAGQSMSYEGKMRRNAARQALNVVSLAAAIQMSGTGELGLTRRLRMSHGQEGASINYGSHMAMHMAMGMLYLGRGYYTLGNSNLAIASLAISCFPRFLPAMGDNKAYPQAFRHLWALAVEPRCLIARDVDTRESIFLPVKLVKRAVNQSGVVPSGLTAKMMSGGTNPDSKANLISNHISPTLIPPMDTLRSIIIDSPRYLPVTFDFDDPRDWATTIATRTVWVKRRAGYIDYAADPRGYRSLMVRAGTMSGFDMHYDLVSPAAPMTVPPADVIELVTTHSTNPVCIAIARNFSGATWLERFARNVLFECLSIDKLVVLGTYLSMALGLQAKDDDGLLLERIAHARLVHRFYRPQTWDKFFSLTAAQKRHPVVRQTFLAALVRNLGADDAVPAWDSTADNTFLARSAGPPSRFAYFAGVAAVGDVALSAYLVRNDVPPMRVLELLRDNVSASAVSTAGGGADKNAQVLVLQCRAVAERYLRAVVGAYAAEAGDVPRWSLDSVMDAIGVWTEGV